MTVRDLIREATGQGGFLLPRQITVHGPLDSAIPGRIDGHVEGDAKVNGKLVIGKDASISGNVTATSLIIHGKVYGNVTVMNKALVGNKAYIKGDIFAQVIDIEKGAIIEGNIHKDTNPALAVPPPALPSAADDDEDGTPVEPGVARTAVPTDINNIPAATIIRQDRDEVSNWW